MVSDQGTSNTLDNYFQHENDDIYEISSITSELSNNKRKRAVDRPLLEVWTHFTKEMKIPKDITKQACKYCHQRWDRAYLSKLEIHLENQCIEFQRSFVVSATNRSFDTVIEFRVISFYNLFFSEFRHHHILV